MASQDWFDKDFYRILGVSKDVSDADLKKTYRKLARTYHPDSNQGDATAEAKFKEISEAYSVLSDAEQRKEYDQIRAMGSGARFTAGGQGAGGFEDVFSMFGQGRGGRAQSPEDFDDIFAMFNQQEGGRFGSGRFGQAERRLPRLRRTDARRGRHGADDDGLHHRDQGRDHHAPGRGRQAVQGQDPRRRRRRPEDPAARARPAVARRRRERRRRGAGDACDPIRCSPARA